MERHKGRDCERWLYSHTLPMPHKAGTFFGAPFYTYTNPVPARSSDSAKVTQQADGTGRVSTKA